MATRRVLIVEDDDLDRQVTSVDLRNEGYVVGEAPTAEHALSAIRSFTPDVIVLDIGLPGDDGLTCLRQIREDPLTSAIPVVLLTARDDLDAQLEGITSGAERYLVKPVDRSHLITTIREVLTNVRE